MENNSATKVKEPVQVMTKDPEKVAAGKRLAEYNDKRKEEMAQADKAWDSEPKPSQAYGIGVVIAAGVLGLLAYYIYQSHSKKGDAIKVNPVRSVEVQT